MCFALIDFVSSVTPVRGRVLQNLSYAAVFNILSQIDAQKQTSYGQRLSAFVRGHQISP